MQILERYDDLAWKRSQAKIVADHTLRITVQGVTIELDLAEANYADVTKYLGELAEAGRVVKGRASSIKGNSKSGNVTRTPRENKLLREWCQANGIMARKGRERWAYLTDKANKNYYPQWLWDMYDAAMEEAHGVGGDRPDRQPADAGNRRGKGRAPSVPGDSGVQLQQG
jgi:Lsr2